MPLQKIHREEELLLSRDCDLGGLWRPSAILTAMQEAAGMHSHILGCGRETLVKQGIVWVLTRCEVRMDREARMGETVSIETFPCRCAAGFSRAIYLPRRGGRSAGRGGHAVGAVRSGKALHGGPGRGGQAIPDNSDLTPPLGVPGPVPRLTGEAVRSARTPVYSELDVNGHVNNARYADWLCDGAGA